MCRHAALLSVTVSVLLVAACGQSVNPPAQQAGAIPRGDTDGTPEQAEPRRVATDEPLVVFLGDSLAAGLGLIGRSPFPVVAGELLRESGLGVRIVNAGVSGDTTAGGLARLDWILRQRPDIVVIELGANDGLRGLPLDMTERNLKEMIRRTRDTGAAVLLLGIRIPPSYGPDYVADFAAIYPRIAAELDVALVESFLEGVGGRPSMNLPDGLHPNAPGHRRLAAQINAGLERLLR